MFVLGFSIVGIGIALTHLSAWNSYILNNHVLSLCSIAITFGFLSWRYPKRIFSILILGVAATGTHELIFYFLEYTFQDEINLILEVPFIVAIVLSLIWYRKEYLFILLGIGLYYLIWFLFLGLANSMASPDLWYAHLVEILSWIEVSILFGIAIRQRNKRLNRS